MTGGPDITAPARAPDGPDISGLTADSRAVAPGSLFAALPGRRADGRAFIPEALANGAVAVLAPDGTPPLEGPARLITHDNPRKAFARMAARFHGRQPETVAAITGTNGKTSTALFTAALWRALGHAGGSLGTLGASATGFERPGALTTPDPVLLHEILAGMAAAGCDRLAMEASSHGLDQFRLDGVRVAAAAFTNLTHDHLDYHGSMAAYRAAKTRLFTEVMAPGGTAVLNADSPQSAALARACAARSVGVMTYGRAGEDLRLDDARPTAGGQDLRLTVLGQRVAVHLPVPGLFQAMNALAALGLVIASGADPVVAARALETLAGVPGRMQTVAALPDGAPVLVDYAHTPDALETVLRGLRPHAAGRLICVFGCGGDRDTSKRPEMGDIAARLADVAIVTDDNPRTEDPAAIRAAILAACPGGIEIGDRAAAIQAGVDMLAPGDVLVLAGKGHEPGQTVGDRVLPFDDAAQARAAVAARLNRETAS
ncbi:UDP-N-acetylmuramoyl-L-alanyl-D-glutamate--2,6-diaminopimelate ligase [Roseospira navarrensis]|uniref:UDP-N-acetylmuramoyl-L-alanyl-D-glutamate--2,6-diaminopimelate ligase n=1 Tax=Roseospira navarrensis TaxID=140058 RepID=A0A7X1ZDV1_9PROT|nr:UDP-N-acetylmuramoyl-L-alanyl-D-glutamate--2,6-diaminopimelate ligase [Roseospira navarrensis]MQX36734.1 UDP-N-acetylmuramoyl-L-alanyl-D-glutamate--2,6-diaminopimelate ligase [Roseospira navarrensis]